MNIIFRIYLTFFLLSLGMIVSAQNVFSLSDCITYAIDNSLELRDYTFQLRESKEDEMYERHKFLPSINAELDNGVSTGFQQVFTEDLAGAYQSVSSYSNVVSFNVSLPLWDASAQRTLVRLRRNNVNEMEQRKAACEQSLKMRVIEKFYTLALAKVRRQLAEEQLVLQDSVLDVSRRMYELGLRAYKDVVDAEANRENDRQTLMEEEQSVMRSLTDLKHVMNYKSDMDIYRVIEDKDTTFFLPLDELERLAFLHSPALRVAESKIVSASLERKSISRQRYPSLTLNFQAGTSAQQLFTLPNTKMTKQWHHNAYQMTTLTLKIPVFNRLNVRSQLRKTDIEIARMQTVLEKECTELRHELKVLYEDMQKCERLVPQMRQVERLVHEQYAMALKDYSCGNIPSYGLYTYKNKWVAASLRLAQANIEWNYKRQMLKTLIE